MLPVRTARVLLTAAAAAVAAFVVACTTETSRTPLFLCDEGADDCAGISSNVPRRSDDVTAARPRNDGQTTPDGQGTETEEEPPPPVDASADVEVDAGPPPLGASCTKLAACCVQLGKQGYVTDTCDGVVQTYNEAACFAQYDRYKQFGDCN